MAWYAYCIAERQSFPEVIHHRKPVPMKDLVGVLGNPVFLYPASDFAVVVSEHGPQDNLNQKSAVDHARVVSGCFRISTVLPFRLGTVFSDDEALRRSVRSNQRQFLANVERLRGKAEMHLKVVMDDIHNECPIYASAASVGREYLSRLRESAAIQRERQTRARAISVQMHRMFSPLEEEVLCKRMGPGKILLDIAHLIDQHTVEWYQNRYASACHTMRECTMALSGPWPPYHFVHQAQHATGQAMGNHGHA